MRIFLVLALFAIERCAKTAGASGSFTAKKPSFVKKSDSVLEIVRSTIVHTTPPIYEVCKDSSNQLAQISRRYQDGYVQDSLLGALFQYVIKKDGSDPFPPDKPTDIIDAFFTYRDMMDPLLQRASMGLNKMGFKLTLRRQCTNCGQKEISEDTLPPILLPCHLDSIQSMFGEYNEWCTNEECAKQEDFTVHCLSKFTGTPEFVIVEIDPQHWVSPHIEPVINVGTMYDVCVILCELEPGNDSDLRYLALIYDKYIDPSNDHRVDLAHDLTAGKPYIPRLLIYRRMLSP